MSDYFHDCHWGQCLELLSHLCQYSDSILLVTGPEGIGKSAMKSALIAQEASQYKFCEVDGHSALTPEQLTVLLERELDLQSDKELMLVIDDTQNLALDVLSIILQLKQKTFGSSKLHVVLFATPDFEQKIAHSILKEDFAEQVHTIDIEPLTLQEMEVFLQQYVRRVNRNYDGQVDRVKSKKIHALSGGIPGKAQEYALEMLSGRNANKEHRGLSPFTVGITVSFGILFCILAILWPAADQTIITQSESSTTEQATIEPEQPTQTVAQTAPEAESPAVDTATEQQSPMVAQTAEVQQAYDEKIVLLEQKLTTLQQQFEKEQKAQRSTEQKLQQLLAKQQPASKTNKTIAKKTLSLTKHEKQILNVPKDHYTLQLLCMTQEDQVKDFLKSNNLQNKARYYRSHFKHKDWYIVVYGDYVNKTDAQFALASLPQTLKKLRPWTREYVNIHESINNRDKNE